jgi:hypothetical protein
MTVSNTDDAVEEELRKDRIALEIFSPDKHSGLILSPTAHQEQEESNEK